MCFMITEETTDTFHCALGSSGRFLEGKEREWSATKALQQRFTKKQVLFVSLEVKEKFTQHNNSMLGDF